MNPLSTYSNLIESLENLIANRKNLNKSEFSSKAAALLHKAEKYGVHLEVQKILEDSNKSDFAIVKNADFSKDYGQIPLRNKEEVIRAAEWLKNYRDRLTYDERKTAAMRILAKSAEFGVIHDEDTERLLFRMAGIGIGDKDIIKNQINKRASYFSRNARIDIAKQLERLIDIINNTDIETFYKEAAHKVAEEVDIIDKLSGISSRYGKGYMLPEDFLFSTTAPEVKEVQENLIENIKTGKYYHKEDFPSINKEVLLDLLGEDNFNQINFLGFVDPTLCNDWLKTANKEEAALFDTVMTFSGISPYAEKIPE